MQEASLSKTVILSERVGIFSRWANQFVRAQQDDRAIVYAGNIRNNPSHNQVLRFIDNYYAEAARLAGAGGCLIISLGHGGANETDSTIGMVDLLPNRALRVEREQVTYVGSDTEEGDISVLSRAPNARACRRFSRYDFDENTRRPQPPEDELTGYMDCTGARSARSRQGAQRSYLRIGTLLRNEGVAEVIFLTCRVGHARNFIERIAQNWGVRVVAYEERVAANRDANPSNPYYTYLVGEERRRYRDRIPDRHMYRSSID
jgi:hypothetical protein